MCRVRQLGLSTSAQRMSQPHAASAAISARPDLTPPKNLSAEPINFSVARAAPSRATIARRSFAYANSRLPQRALKINSFPKIVRSLARPTRDSLPPLNLQPDLVSYALLHPLAPLVKLL